MNTETTSLRRFEVADLNYHGAWLLPRLMRAFPHLDERNAMGFLRGLIYSNESHFLYQNHSVALAQLDRSNVLHPIGIIYERFVFAQSDEYVDEAANFYPAFVQWGARLGCDNMVIEEHTDVPGAKIRAKLKKHRIAQTPTTFVKLSEMPAEAVKE